VTARSRVDRDLVLALRSELAAIDPARTCDRRALALGIGRTTATRDPVLGRLAIRLGLGSTRDPRGASRADAAAEGAPTDGGEDFAWGPARDVRANQPLMAISDPPKLAPDPAVRRVRPDELEILYPACVAMFTEEVGISPANGDGGSLYRTRVGELIGQGRAFARIDDGRVVFKAEVGAATANVCQIQGVWVDPALRGLGYANGGMAAVVALAPADVAGAVMYAVGQPVGVDVSEIVIRPVGQDPFR